MPLLSARRGTCGHAPAIFGDPAPPVAAPPLLQLAPTLDPSVPSDDPQHTPIDPPLAGAPSPMASHRADASDGAGATALDTWHDLLTSYLGARPVGVSADGEAFPETTAGDVRRISSLLSRELCRPRYDAANLTATRDAWREALARTRALCARIRWLDPYPENERFWLSDSLALAQRLAAVDVRRNGIIPDEHGALVLVVGDRGDPLTLWGDLRQFFLGRRTNHRSPRGLSYPATTVGDVVQVAQIFDGVALRSAPRAPIPSDVRARYEGVVLRWRAASQRVAMLSKARAATTVYPENDRFWLADAKHLAMWVSVLREAALSRPAASQSVPS